MDYSVEVIVAVAINKVIGHKGVVPWNLPSDRKLFQDLTLNHPVVMGRVTYFSIPEKYRPLKNRVNIVVSKDMNLYTEGAHVCHSFEEALNLASKVTSDGKIFVAGGEKIYKLALPYTHVIHFTLVHTEPYIEGDTFFAFDPVSNTQEWLRGDMKKFPKDEYPKNQYSFIYTPCLRKVAPKSFV